jgi:hypothetical protein
MKIELSPELKAALELRHRKIHDGHERDRIKAMLLRSEDWALNRLLKHFYYMKQAYPATLMNF